MVSNLQHSLSGLYEIAKTLNKKIINVANADYTAFEVYVTDVEIPSGTLYKNLPEEISGYVPSEYLDETTIMPISADLTFKLKIRDDVAKMDITKSNVEVDFGDGTIIPIQNTDPGVISHSGNNFIFNHTYENPGKYIVKIFGDTYFNFADVDDYKKGKICRCLDEDLPIASCVYSLNGAFQNSPALLNIKFSDKGKTFKQLTNITNFQYMLNDCQNLLSVTGFSGYEFNALYKPNFSRNLVGMFSACYNLRICDFKPMQSNAYNELFNGDTKLAMPISELLPLNFAITDNQGDNFGGKYKLNLNAMFYDCFSLTGTVPAKILWEDPEADEKFGWGFEKPFGHTLYTAKHYVAVEVGTAYVANKYYFHNIGIWPEQKMTKMEVGVDYNVGETVTTANSVFVLKDLTDAEYDHAISFLSQIPTSWGGTNEEIEAKIQAKYWAQPPDGEFIEVNNAIQNLINEID